MRPNQLTNSICDACDGVSVIPSLNQDDGDDVVTATSAFSLPLLLLVTNSIIPDIRPGVWNICPDKCSFFADTYVIMKPGGYHDHQRNPGARQSPGAAR
jgi:hypothetical protein